MDAALHFIIAMHDRSDRLASVLWSWLRQYHWSTEQLGVYLGCTPTTLERLALAPRPQLGDDWEDDVEIIAVSLGIDHEALRALLMESEAPAEREYGA